MGQPSRKKKKDKLSAPEKTPAVGTARSRPPVTKGKRLRDAQLPVICALLFITVLVVFWPCLKNDFINYDDDYYAYGNPAVQNGFSVQSVVWAFTNVHAANWHPLTWLSHILDSDLFGLKPAGHHFVNILLHAINAVLLFLVLELMTGARWRCLTVAALFAFHPLRVESVAWVAERKDVLSTLFWLLTIWAHVRYARALPTGGRFRLFYGLALGFFVLALLSKPMVVTLPFTLLLLDYWPLQRKSPWRTVWLEKIPYFALTIGVCIVTFIAQKSGGAVSNKIPFYIRCETAVFGYFRYLGKMFWPTGLALPYPYPQHWPTIAVGLSVIGLAVISLLAVVYRKRSPWLPVGWFWYVGTLVPVIGLVQVGMQSMADRYTYVPGIGIAVILVWGGSTLWQRWHAPAGLLVAITLVPLCACIFLTQKQISYWQNGGTVFAHAAAVTTDNDAAYEHLGDYEFKHGNLEAAMTAFRETTRIDPSDEEAVSGIAYILFFNAGQRDAGIAELEKGVRLRPDSPLLRNNLGMFYKEAKRYPEAEVQLREALRLKPDYFEADVGLAYICLKDGRRDEGISLLKHALQISPDLAVAKKMLHEATDGNR